MAAERLILHVDMDAFYAAIEQRDRPELRGRPVLVGGDPQGRGVVSTASYEARPFGCHSAMPMALAVRRCPQAVIVPPRISRYVEVSHQILDIFERFTPLVEPLSIDEAFLDVSGSTALLGDGVAMARDLKRSIHETTQLTGSVGVAPNKFLAKLASDLEKPDGLTVVPPGAITAFLDPIPIGRLWGVGKATLPKFQSLGVQTFGDARRLGAEALCSHFGRTAGEHYHALVCGRDDRPVVCDREAKSISHEITFAQDIADMDQLRAIALDLLDQVARRLRRGGLTARTVRLKIRSGDFSTITRSASLDTPTDRSDQLWAVAADLFERWRRTNPPPARLFGVGVSQLSTSGGEQLGLFEQDEVQRGKQVDAAVDAIRDRFGDAAIRRGPHGEH